MQAVVHANVRWIVVLSDRHRFGEVLCEVSTRLLYTYCTSAAALLSPAATFGMVVVIFDK